MAIQNEIIRIERAKADIAEAIRNHGVAVPQEMSLDGYAAKVNEIVSADVQMALMVLCQVLKLETKRSSCKAMGLGASPLHRLP